MPSSHLHHYIPQFYIRGFQGADGYYWVYDKVNDRIRRYNSAKSFFYENDRHTVEENGQVHSHVEDVVFSKLDSLLSEGYAQARDAVLGRAELTPMTWAGLMALVITMFWRVPKTDAIWDEFFDRALTIQGGMDTPEQEEFVKAFKASPTMRKAYRAFLYVDTHLRLQKAPDSPITNRLVDIDPEQGSLLLSDYPILYEEEPASLEGVVKMPFFMPLTSKRLYTTAARTRPNPTAGQLVFLNALLLNNSVRYTCCDDRSYLEQCVRAYKLYKQQNALPLMRALLFAGDELTDRFMREWENTNSNES